MAVTAAMAMAMTAAMEAVRGATEAAIDRAAIGTAVRTWHSLQSGATATSRRKAHRYGADGRRTHQCQHDTARAFHVAVPAVFMLRDRSSLTTGR